LKGSNKGKKRGESSGEFTQSDQNNAKVKRQPRWKYITPTKKSKNAGDVGKKKTPPIARGGQSAEASTIQTKHISRERETTRTRGGKKNEKAS